MRTRVLLAALGLTLAQVGLVVAVAPGHSYSRLLNWDSFHYVDIVENGYHVVASPTSDDIHAGRANAVFFPGYPWAAGAVRAATGGSTAASLLAVAQAAAVLFWVYFLSLVGADIAREGGLIRRILGARGASEGIAAVIVAVFPASFFLVVGYTESLFLAATLGFVYWTRRWLRQAPGGTATAFWVLAAIHGYVMCLTRIVGIGVAVYPGLAIAVFIWGNRRVPPLARLLGAALLTLASFEGAATFFLFCQKHLGDWRIYFKLEEIGWGNIAYPLALLDPRSYIPHYFFEPTEDSISRSAVPLIAGTFVWLGIVEWRARLAGIWERLPLYLVAFFMFQIAVAAKANAKMDSMVRYALPVFVLLVVAGEWLRRERSRAGAGAASAGVGVGRAEAPARTLGWVLIGTLSLAVQLWLAYRFTHGHWAA